MICRKCGKAIPDDSVFCQHCGAKVKTVEEGKSKKTIVLETIAKLKENPRMLGIAAGCVGVLLVVLVLIFALRESPVDRAQKAIDAIGTVTMDSQGKIQQAEALYEELSRKDKAEVQNADVLADAREAYDQMVDAVETASKAMAAAKEVTYYVDGKPGVDPKDQDTVVAARTAYTVLEKYGLTEYVAEQMMDLKDAEEGLTYVHGAKLFQEAQENAQQGIHQKAVSLYKELLSSYPDYRDAQEAVNNMCYSLNALGQAQYIEKNYEDALKLFNESLDQDPNNKIAASGATSSVIKLVEEHFEEDEFEEAEKLLDDAIKRFGATQEFAIHQEKLQKKLEKIRPENGDYVEKFLPGGRGELKVTAGDKAVLVKVESAEDWTKYRSFYVKPNDEATMSVGDGLYRIKCAEGDTWYGKEYLFGENTAYMQLDDLVEFDTEYIDNYYRYTEITLNLSDSAVGSLDATAISEDDF